MATFMSAAAQQLFWQSRVLACALQWLLHPRPCRLSQATRQSSDKCSVLLIDLQQLLLGHFYERSSTAAVLAI